MALDSTLHARAGDQCELCGTPEALAVYPVPRPEGSASGVGPDEAALLCSVCCAQLEGDAPLDPHHWRCLNESMWSVVPAVQVLAWRLLHRLRPEGWPQALLDQLYLDDDTLAWARASGDHLAEADRIVHRDSNGAELASGDTVVLVKDLNVKGAGFTAKRGTAVRGITLDAENADYIDGKVEGTAHRHPDQIRQEVVVQVTLHEMPWQPAPRQPVQRPPDGLASRQSSA